MAVTAEITNAPDEWPLRPMCLAGIDELIDRVHRDQWAMPSALVMTPCAFDVWCRLVVQLGGRMPSTEERPTYCGIPIIMSGTPQDLCIVGALCRTALHGKPMPVVCFSEPA